MEIREAKEHDLIDLMKLYTQLNNNPMPDVDEKLSDSWKRMLKDDNHHIIVATFDEIIVSSCVLIIIPNLTHEQRPYALIENVITDEMFRKRGFGTAVLNYAKELAFQQNCYKIMLMTGSKRESTLRFYERAGYNKNDKTAFIQWL